MYTRMVDKQGRVVLPVEVRKGLGLTEHSEVTINYEKDKIILVINKMHCKLCGSDDCIIETEIAPVCKSCIEGIKDQIELQNARKSIK